MSHEGGRWLCTKCDIPILIGDKYTTGIHGELYCYWCSADYIIRDDKVEVMS